MRLSFVERVILFAIKGVCGRLKIRRANDRPAGPMPASVVGDVDVAAGATMTRHGRSPASQ